MIILKQTISRKELCGYLNLLRKTMTDPKNFPPSHVHFFNSRSFYYYFSKCPCGSETVEEILLQMESCIPLAITDESLQLFLSAYNEEDSPYLAHSFLESSKADFLLLLRHAADDDGKWRAVIMLCDGLREKNLT
ncbi:MAG: hypothetical protein ACK5I7_00740 [Anaerotignum sp.]